MVLPVAPETQNLNAGQGEGGWFGCQQIQGAPVLHCRANHMPRWPVPASLSLTVTAFQQKGKKAEHPLVPSHCACPCRPPGTSGALLETVQSRGQLWLGQPHSWLIVPLRD